MNKERELISLRSVEYDLQRAQEAVEEFERNFPDYLHPGGQSPWAHLDCALEDTTRQVSNMIKDRTPKYHVVGIVTPLNQMYPAYKREVQLVFNTFEEAQAYTAEKERAQCQDGPGTAKWWFYIQEVYDA